LMEQFCGREVSKMNWDALGAIGEWVNLRNL